MSAKEIPKSKPATDAFREGHKAIWGRRKKNQSGMSVQSAAIGFRLPL